MWCEHATLSRVVSTLPLGQSVTETHPHPDSFCLSWHRLCGLRIWDSSVLTSLPKFWWLFLFLYFKLTNYLVNLKVSPYQRHISEWEEWHNTLFTQVLKGWTDFLLGTAELKDFPVAQLERTNGWLGQQNQCCTAPLWLQGTGSGCYGTIISA